MQAAFEPVSRGELIYSALYPLLWIIPLFHRSRLSFQRFIIAREGVRRRRAAGVPGEGA